MIKADKHITNNLQHAYLWEEHSVRMLILFAVIVMLLHMFGIMWLKRSPLPVIASHAQPLKLEVSLLSIAAPESSAALPSQTPQPKPTIKKNRAVTPKPADSPTSEQVLNSRYDQQVTKAVKSQSTLQTTQTVTSSILNSASQHSYAKDNFLVTDESNPSPEYPEMAIFLGYEGRAIVRIHVSAKGLTERIEILVGSGHKILDESATSALKKWRFIPNKRGEKAVADSVIIAVNFTLHD